jgi:hypothetical protein
LNESDIVPSITVVRWFSGVVGLLSQARGGALPHLMKIGGGIGPISISVSGMSDGDVEIALRQGSRCCSSAGDAAARVEALRRTVEACHVAPDWPDGDLQRIHSDFYVDDFDAAHEQVITLGGRLLKAADDRAAPRGVQVYAAPLESANSVFFTRAVLSPCRAP